MESSRLPELMRTPSSIRYQVVPSATMEPTAVDASCAPPTEFTTVNCPTLLRITTELPEILIIWEDDAGRFAKQKEARTRSQCPRPGARPLAVTYAAVPTEESNLAAYVPVRVTPVWIVTVPVTVTASSVRLLLSKPEVSNRAIG